MKKIIIFSIALMSLPALTLAQKSGDQIFKSVCSACHTIGKGKLVGPDLNGVHAKYPESWLISFIRSSQTMVKKGDAKAVKIFNEYNKIPMPDNNLTDAEIKNVINYIKQNSTVKTTTTVTTETKTETKTETVKETKVAPWTPSDISITSKKVATELNARDLDNSMWQTVSATNIPLAAQNIVYPNLHETSLAQMSVKSVYNGNKVAIWMEWNDTSKDVFVEVDQFSDQVAIQLPVDVNNIPSYMMGNAGGYVHIIHWKAVWQEDCENGFRDIKDAYPNATVDIYPGQESQLDRSRKLQSINIRAEEMVEKGTTFNMPGTASGNFMSKIKRQQPVEEASAVGFGTLTSMEDQTATGWARHQNGKWTVCIIFDVNSGNKYKAAMKDKTKIAFAVWDGNKENIGGRKHYAQWADLILEK